MAVGEDVSPKTDVDDGDLGPCEGTEKLFDVFLSAVFVWICHCVGRTADKNSVDIMEVAKSGRVSV